MKRAFFYKFNCCNTLQAKTLSQEPQASKLRIKRRYKKLPKNKPRNKLKCRASVPETLPNYNPKINPKSMKILFLTPSCPSCSFHGPPRCSGGAKIAPPSAKMAAPSLRNGNCEELKGAGGRGCRPENINKHICMGIIAFTIF